MTLNDIMPWLGLAISILAPVIGYLQLAARTDEKLTSLTERVTRFEALTEKKLDEFVRSSHALERELSQFETDRANLRLETTRLESSKASRESVDGVQREVASLRNEVVGRLDRLEVLVREALSEKSSG